LFWVAIFLIVSIILNKCGLDLNKILTDIRQKVIEKEFVLVWVVLYAPLMIVFMTVRFLSDLFKKIFPCVEFDFGPNHKRQSKQIRKRIVWIV